MNFFNQQRGIGPWVMAIGLTALFVLCPKAYAADDEPNPLGFTVQAIRPDTQIETNKTYFHIETQPGVTQVLKVKLKGMKKEPVKLIAYVVNGRTGASGDIEYAPSIEKIDVSLKQPLTEIVQLSDTEITLENFEEKTIDVEVRSPAESYAGIKLGALVFELIEEQAEVKKAVSSKFQYRVGLITTETGEEYEDAKALDLVSAKLGLKLGKKQVSAVIHNSEPKIADNLKIEAIVTKKGSDNVLKKQVVENARMAPNSTYEFLMDWGVDAVKAGDYVIKIHAKNDLDDWQWQKEFSVSGDRARQMNDESPFQLKVPKWVPIAVIITLSLMVVVVVSLRIRSTKWRHLLKERSRKKKAQQETKRKRRHKRES